MTSIAWGKFFGMLINNQHLTFKTKIEHESWCNSWSCYCVTRRSNSSLLTGSHFQVLKSMSCKCKIRLLIIGQQWDWPSIKSCHDGNFKARGCPHQDWYQKVISRFMFMLSHTCTQSGSGSLKVWLAWENVFYFHFCLHF